MTADKSSERSEAMDCNLTAFMVVRSLLLLLLLVSFSSPSSAVDFLFDSFAAASSDLILDGDARVDSSVLRLTNDSSYYSIGRAFYSTRLRMLGSSGGADILSSFSSSFVFSILPEISTSPGFGLAFSSSKDRLLGSGGFGKVYRGVLQNSDSGGVDGGDEAEEVAVKCVSHDSKQGLREFMAEISTTGRLQHHNLVQMRGWCREGNELMLIYEYMPNGNLSQWIFSDETDRRPLDWPARRRVLLDVAEGLQYLYHGWEKVVLHRDVKSSNILLDGEMRGRLGDFGLAKLYERGAAPSSTRVVGTLGYLAPELASVAIPTAASDVYSFGVVALEVACGRRPIERAATVEDDDWLLVDWVRNMHAQRQLAEAADRRMAGHAAADVELVLKLGLACCHPDPEQRPNMKEVVELLLAVTDESAGKHGSLSAPSH